MKKLITLIFILAGLSIAQTVSVNTAEGKAILFKNAFTLSSSATVYSDAIPVDGYMPYDSLTVIPIQYSATDTCVVTITLEGKVSIGGSETAWTAIGTVVTSYSPAGNDSLGVKLLNLYGTIAATAQNGKGVSLSGFHPNLIRIKAAYTNKTTVGNGGNLKVWLKLKK